MTPHADPWIMQIAMLPVRRAKPAAGIDARQPKAAHMQKLQRIKAERDSRKTQARILATLRAAAPDGLTADEISLAINGKPAGGNTYRQLGVMAAAGTLTRRKINKMTYRWEITCP